MNALLECTLSEMSDAEQLDRYWHLPPLMEKSPSEGGNPEGSSLRQRRRLRIAQQVAAAAVSCTASRAALVR